MGWVSLQEDVQKLRDSFEHVAKSNGGEREGSRESERLSALEKECRTLLVRLEGVIGSQDADMGDLLLQISNLRRDNQDLKNKLAVLDGAASSDTRLGEASNKINELERVNSGLRVELANLKKAKFILSQEISKKSASISRLRLALPSPLAKRRKKR